ncbi:MAG: hypothetical protein R3235_09610 [Altererythrobacter ishigakiensis]|nr:hypothetical protein [Altererythrobacter ishigakiensis]
MTNIYKGLLGAGAIIAVALVAKSAGVGQDVSFGLVTAISGFTALWITRGANDSGTRCA